MITIDDLTVTYGAVQALRGVAFVAETGKITAVLGANGAGKTTLLRTISGLKEPKSGTIRMGERHLVGMKTEDIARLGIGHVPEGRGVIGEFTVEENLRLGQMMAMARALIAKPSVLLLDEPSLGLAPLVTAQLMHTIRSLCETSDLTVILVEQNASSALRIAHHAIVLHVGKVVANDTASVVAADGNLRQYYLGLVE